MLPPLMAFHKKYIFLVILHEIWNGSGGGGGTDNLCIHMYVGLDT